MRVIYCDEAGTDHDALVTVQHGPECATLVIIERGQPAVKTSVMKYTAILSLAPRERSVTRKGKTSTETTISLHRPAGVAYWRR